tara:strand:+ start:2323 stop:3282 length:960 start_codon:yes stop_codon:yes gene_type:complete
MNKSIIEKYKPTEYRDFHFFGNITNLIEMYINLNKMKLLIVGEHSTGKSTLINVIINNYFKDVLPKDVNDNILYVNPLQEQGISYYRNEVKIFCQTYCTVKNKKKLIIMDDFDLIHEQSQQVFRSLIDKYESNVNFIVSTSNVYKIIDTIQSRLITVKIPNITSNILMNICNKIIDNEKITIEKETFNLFIKICDNNIQLMLQYLESFRLLNTKISDEIIYDVCSHINHTVLDTYFNNLRNNDIEKSINNLLQLHSEGYNVMDILDAIFSYIKITKEITEEIKYKLIKYLCKFITIFHEIHEDEIELAIFTNNIIHLFQ